MFEVETTREGPEVVLAPDPEAKPWRAGKPPPHGHGLEAESRLWWRRGGGRSRTFDIGEGAVSCCSRDATAGPQRAMAPGSDAFNLRSPANALAGGCPYRSGDANPIEAPRSGYEQTGHDHSQEGHATHG